MGYILGLDLGSNSLGWACINKKNKRILGMGSRIFKEGVNKDSKGKEVSKNEARRLARQSRRQYFRKKQRKNMLIEILQKHGMFPESNGAIDDFFMLNPYSLRKKGLDKKLSKLEIGRIMFHINQRRGFKSSRKSDPEKKEKSILHASTTELQKAINLSKCRTLGEYFEDAKRKMERVRDNYTLRKMYEEELNLIWKKQKKFYKDLSEELINKIESIIFYQRPLKSVSAFIGKCSLEEDKKRCRKDSLEAQEFRILEQVNRLKYFDEEGVEQQFSKKTGETFTENIQIMRDKLIDGLKVNKELKFEKIKKMLELPKHCTFNLEKGEKEKKLIGNRTGYEFTRVFGKKWHNFSTKKKEKVYQVFTMADDAEWLEKYAMENWELTHDKAKIMSTKLRLEQGYMHHSKKAIIKLNPFLNDACSYADAVVEAGYSIGQKYENIETQLKKLRNPIVLKTLYEMLRLLKQVSKVFGKPEKVKVELARELKLSSKKRNEIRFENFERQKINEEIRSKLQEMNVKPTGEALLRYKLWKECKEKCPYTGKEISFAALFSESPEFQIEHIIPKERSLDDSFMNKTLCHEKENRSKGNQTPYEAYHGTEQYDQILKQIRILPYPKRKKFTQKEVDDNFISRQLNDTAYISREAFSLLKSLGYSVSITKGQATAELRYLWGLNSLLKKDTSFPNVKNRDDHRHHAIDAAVVAMTDDHILYKLSAYNKYSRKADEKTFSSPWVAFREDLKPFIKRLLVSHQLNNRTRGALHEETFYGETGRQNKKGEPLYAVRKPLEQLTPAMIDKIIDPVVKELIKNHLRSLGIDPDEKKFKIPTNAFKEHTIYMKSNSKKRVPIKKVRIEQVKNKVLKISKLNKTAVEPGNNHHIVIFQEKDKKGKIKQKGEICTLFEAAHRATKKKPIIQRNLENYKNFICSLAENELVLLDIDEKDINWKKPDYEKVSKHLYRVQKISDVITFRHHLVAVLKDENNEEPGILSKSPTTFRGIKVKMDRLGRISKAND
tara:strand:- start:2806 stop:5829 length:3024 start_codon:yes stop_codon:yes gene_type:complete